MLAKLDEQVCLIYAFAYPQKNKYNNEKSFTNKSFAINKSASNQNIRQKPIFWNTVCFEKWNFEYLAVLYKDSFRSSKVKQSSKICFIKMVPAFLNQWNNRIDSLYINVNFRSESPSNSITSLAFVTISVNISLFWCLVINFWSFLSRQAFPFSNKKVPLWGNC